MDSLIFEKWLSGDGYGYGYGDGDGSGSGSGDGYGYGYGYGYGDGDGDGDGDGSGSGYGDGYGYGYGDGDGDGDGDGSGSGYGDGDGDGYGYGYGDGYKILKHKGKKVFYVDGIPCLPIRTKGKFAFVEVIGKDMRIDDDVVIAKGHGLFAHGKDIRKAAKALEEKRIAKMDVESRKKEFLQTFKQDEKYLAKDFFVWHGILTGSCESGREHFANKKGIDLEKDMFTLAEFYEITKNAYGGDTIRELGKL